VVAQCRAAESATTYKSATCKHPPGCTCSVGRGDGCGGAPIRTSRGWTQPGSATSSPWSGSCGSARPSAGP
jgi:hypothetical protein